VIRRIKRFMVDEKQYCGPGPLTVSANKKVNEACRRHDSGYGEIGRRAYFQYNKADQEFLDTLSKIHNKGVTGRIAQVFFTAKKYLTPTMPGTNVFIVEDKTGRKYTGPITRLQSKKAYQEEHKQSYKRPVKKKKPYLNYKFSMKSFSQSGTSAIPYTGYQYKRNGRYSRQSNRKRGKSVTARTIMARKRYYKKRRYNKKGSWYNKVRKVARSVVDARAGTTRFWHGQDTGQVSNGLVASPTTSAANRSITFGLSMMNASTELKSVLSDLGQTPAIRDRYIFRNYREKWTFVNSHAFPVYMTVYEVSLKNDMNALFGLSADYTDAATERALYQTDVPDDNSITGQLSYHFPISLLWKWNLYRGANLDSSLTDNYRSYLDYSSFGSGSPLAVINRHHLHTSFKIPGMARDMKLTKLKVVTIDAGQTFVHSFYKKFMFIDAAKLNQTTYHLKGRTGLIFHVTGSLVHESDDTYNDVGRSPIQLDWELKRYCRIDLLPQSDDDAFKHYSDRNYTIVGTAEQMDNETSADVGKG
jgi:hypothetical protein